MPSITAERPGPEGDRPPRTIAAASVVALGGEITIRRLGFGAARITGPGAWGDPSNRDEAKRVLRRAVELGVNFIDTADSYGPGTSEDLITEALAPYPPDLVIATKGGLRQVGPDTWLPAGRPDQLRTACEESLRRLGLESIPLYQLHQPDPDVPLEEAIGVLVDLQRAGKIRQIGVSNLTETQLIAAFDQAEIVSTQNRYNLIDRGFEHIVGLCEERGIAFLPWAPISGIVASPVLDRLARGHGVATRALCLAWLLARSPCLVAIPGTGSLAHLEENMRAASVALSDDEFGLMSRLAA